MFAILFGVYAFCETDFCQFMVPNSYLVYAATFLSLSLLPFPILMIFKGAVDPSHRTLLIGLIYLNFLIFLLQIILNFSHILDFRETLSWSHILDLISILAILYACIFTNKKNYPHLRPLLFSLLPAFVGVIIDLSLFYVGYFAYNSFFFQFGILIFIVTQIFLFLSSYFKLTSETLQAKIYQELAFTDILTHLGNRNAYEEYIHQTESLLTEHSNLWCISADLNNLKNTNDQFGHLSGDTLIYDTGSLLRYCLGSDCKIFRTGGDEFVAFLMDRFPEEVEKCLSLFREKIDSYNKTHTPPIRIALGAGCYDFQNDQTLIHLISRVDALMYEDKRQTKQQEKVPNI